MKWFFGNDRRQGDRRENGHRDSARQDDSDCREDCRRVTDHRSCMRVNLPPADTLQVLGSDPEYFAESFRVLNILSEKAIGLVCVGDSNPCVIPLVMGEEVGATIEFHDGTIFEFKGNVVRYSSDLNTRNSTVICKLLTHIPVAIIKEELDYLVRQYEGYLAEMDGEIDPAVLAVIE